MSESSHPIHSSHGGPGVRAFLSALAVPAGATVLFAFRLAEHPASRRMLDGSWIVPAIDSKWFGAALFSMVLTATCLASRSWRPAAPAVATPALVVVLLSRGGLPSPHTVATTLPMLLDNTTTRPLVTAAAAESTALTVAGLALTLALYRGARAVGSDAAKAAHGTARFATGADLRAADLVSGEGVVLGCRRTLFGLTPLTDRSEDHVLLMMSTGAGKTTGPIASTLLNTNSPALVLDPKGELWELTAGWRRQQGQHVVRFDPLGRGPHSSWNPLEEIERGRDEIAVLSLLAGNLITFPASLQGEDHWTASARSLLRCLALHALYDEDTRSFAGIRDLLNSGPLDDIFTNLAKSDHNPDGSRGWTDPFSGEPTATHPEVIRLARSFANTPPKERGSIVSTLQRFLDLWGDPRVADATHESEWHLAMLTDAPKPTTVYITVPTAHLSRMAPLLRALVALLVHRVSLQDVTGPPAPRRLLLVLDEFGALGRIPILEDVLTFLRGYGVRSLLAVQDLAQLRRLYGPHHSITSNCRIHLAAASPDVQTRHEISRRLGEATWAYRKTSRADRLLSNRRTISQAEVRRPLLTEGEIGTLPADQLLVVKAGHPPVLAHKLPYWRHPELAERATATLASRPDLQLRNETAHDTPSRGGST